MFWYEFFLIKIVYCIVDNIFVGGCWVHVQFGVKICVNELPSCFSHVVCVDDDDCSHIFVSFCDNYVVRILKVVYRVNFPLCQVDSHLLVVTALR